MLIFNPANQCEVLTQWTSVSWFLALYATLYVLNVLCAKSTWKAAFHVDPVNDRRLKVCQRVCDIWVSQPHICISSEIRHFPETADYKPLFVETYCKTKAVKTSKFSQQHCEPLICLPDQKGSIMTVAPRTRQAYSSRFGWLHGGIRSLLFSEDSQCASSLCVAFTLWAHLCCVLPMSINDFLKKWSPFSVRLYHFDKTLRMF